MEEMVAMFLHILAHDVKNRIVQREFVQSSETNCLGALDGTYIKVNFSATGHPRYRTRKGEIATNVFDVCDTNGNFVFVLSGWEGFTADSRVSRDVISRPNGLKVPKGYYYLCDVGYPNAEGFLAPYKGERYHLSEWRGGGNAPTAPREFFNMKHSSAWNVIERTLGLLKGRWAILRGQSYYPVQIQCRTIMACCLLHNFINREMTNSELIEDLDEVDSSFATTRGNEINYIESSNEWTQWRNKLAQ
ncbi:protein ALP1-like [Benincasa hispida]|uniref:protein ALP1-like n=1 Tax=Benincasa hispida TaxID=102211 RepID=UPI001900269A|nr:protein ALP1-like [Benincasa hispida]